MARQLIGWRMITGLVLAAVLFGTAPAAHAAASGGTHCIVEVGPTPATGGEVRCFRTFAEALNVATQGKAQATPSLTPRDLTPTNLPQGVGEYVLAVAYKDINYSGDSLTIYSTAGDCRQYSTFSWPNVGSAWNDVISSIDLFGGCSSAVLYQHENFGGASYYVYSKSPNLGWFNDLTTSIIIRR